MARILLAALAALLICVPTANATVVLTHTYGIWIMEDDGSNPRPLFGSSEADVDEFLDATVHPGGTTVSFTGITRAYGSYSPPAPPLACGLHCYGIHTYAANAFTRLSPESKACAGNPCATFSGHSEPASDGSVLGEYYAKSWDVTCNGNTEWCSSGDASQTLIREPAGDGEAQVIETGCESASEPVPHPANPSLVMFIGCSDYSFTPSRHYLSTIDGQGQVTHIVHNDGGFRDPAWSADGSQIVTSELGSQPGLWVSPAADPFNGGRWVLDSANDDLYIGHPRLAGDKVLFLYQNDVWSIPATCSRCALSQATRLTTSADVKAIGWTSKTLTPYVKPGTVGSGGGGGSTTGTCTSNCGTAQPPPPAPPVVTPAPLEAGYALAGRRTLRGLLAGRLSFRLACDCTVTATLALGRVVVAKGAGKGTVKLRPTKAGKRRLKRLRKAKLKLTVRAGDRRFTRTVSLKR